MSFAGSILIALVTIGAILFLVVAVIAKAVYGVTLTTNEVFDWLGRKKLGVVANIPAELESAGVLSKRRDPEFIALAAYKPRIPELPPRKPVIYRPSRKLTDEEVTFSRRLNVDDIQLLLAPSSTPAYEVYALWVEKTPVYPVKEPSPPVLPEPPPNWTKWQHEIPDPEFEPPLYTDWRTFLNGFVESAYQDQRRRVQDALFRKHEIEAANQKRDSEIAGIAEKASAMWRAACDELNARHAEQILEHHKHAASYLQSCSDDIAHFKEWKSRIAAPGREGLLARIEMTMRTMDWLDAIPRESRSSFDPETGVLIHEHRFPDPAEIEFFKVVESRSRRSLGSIFDEADTGGGQREKPPNKTELKEAITKLWPSICLRLAYELVRVDQENIVKAIAVNGWAEFTEQATGHRKRAYCASLFAAREKVAALNLVAIDPVVAFRAFRGIASPSLEITPIAPIVRLNTDDRRFVDGKEILARMVEGENLAMMDWEAFEHLCRELFERAFAGSGAEVKVTRASRDQGVDAVIFDPDPLRGGKIVIQAKRYTNTVDVSAIRDLYGAVINEGANKGIIVTTSQYGPEAYEFAKGKPITLLNGAELLGLLEQYGYRFRIDLAEARAMLS